MPVNPVNVSQGTTPARRTTPKTPVKPTPQPAVNPASAREEGVKGLFQVGAAICIMRELYADAGACVLHSEKISHEAAVLAETNEGIAKGLDYLIQMGPYSALLTAVLPFALQIAANHGKIDAEKATGLGVLSPADLEEKIKADVENDRLRFRLEAAEARKQNEKLLAEAKGEAV
jgi:hypothetical protein